MDSQEWARAVDLFSQVAKLDPKNADVAKKLARVEREARLISLYKAGSRALDGTQWEEAVNHFNVIVELEPGYRDTDNLLSKAHYAFKAENSQKFIVTRYREGVAHFEAERWSNAVEAFSDVHQLDPEYKDVDQLLTDANRNLNPSLVDRISAVVSSRMSQNTWRWGLVAAGLFAIVLLFFALGTGNRVSGNDDTKERLKLLYEEAIVAVESGKEERALSLLEQILIEDPDYADAAAIKRDLIATPTVVPAPTVIVATAVVEINPLDTYIEEAQDAVSLALWDEAIASLEEVRVADPDYEEPRVASLFCDAYVGRGLENIANIGPEDDEEKIARSALADFTAGTAECPRRTDLKDQAERAEAYLKALETPENDFETLIPILTPIVAADPGYANKKVKNLLYQAYLLRAKARQESPEMIAAALGDYEAALALNVDDPGAAQTRRAEILLLFSQQPVQGTPQPEATAVSSTTEGDLATPSQATPALSPTPERTPVRIKYARPKIVGPPDDTIFSGRFAEVILEWEPVAGLAEDEYYDLTIMHLFADEPQYAGSRRTREARIRLESESIPVGEAGNDRFYWWVTVRKDGSASSSQRADLPLSPRSEAGTFIWSP
jgi:tetratricopeptide (TPR) repeat protein